MCSINLSHYSFPRKINYIFFILFTVICYLFSFFFLNLDYCLLLLPCKKLVRITIPKRTTPVSLCRALCKQSTLPTPSPQSVLLWVMVREFKNLCLWYNNICLFLVFPVHSTSPLLVPIFFFHMSAARASRVNDHICGIFKGLRKVSVSYIPPFLSYDYFF